eukprot:979851-Prymnesium_polylepis.1
MEFCSDRRWQLPHYVLARFPPRLIRESVVWQTVGAGFMMRAANRFRGDCASINSDQVAARELEYVNEHGMRHYNYTALALQYAPLMFDAIHFTYYWVPCAQTFPELARLVAQLGFQHAVGRPVQVCARVAVATKSTLGSSRPTRARQSRARQPACCHTPLLWSQERGRSASLCKRRRRTGRRCARPATTR